MEVAAFQQQLAQAHRGIVGVRQEGVFDNDAGAAPSLENLDEVLEEQESGLAGADGEVLLHLGPFLAAEGRIGHHHVVAILFLNVGEVFGEGVGVDDVWCLDTVQDHIHDPDDVGEGLLFLPVKGALLKNPLLRRRALGVGVLQVNERLAEESAGARRGIVDAFANARFHDIDDGAFERARGVILAAVAPGVAHVLDLGLVEVGELVLVGL